MAEILLPNKEQIDKIIKLKSGIEPIVFFYCPELWRWNNGNSRL